METTIMLIRVGLAAMLGGLWFIKVRILLESADPETFNYERGWFLVITPFFLLVFMLLIISPFTVGWLEQIILSPFSFFQLYPVNCEVLEQIIQLGGNVL